MDISTTRDVFEPVGQHYISDTGIAAYFGDGNSRDEGLLLDNNMQLDGCGIREYVGAAVVEAQSISYEFDVMTSLVPDRVNEFWNEVPADPFKKVVKDIFKFYIEAGYIYSEFPLYMSRVASSAHLYKNFHSFTNGEGA